MHETCRNNFYNGHSSKPENLIRFQLHILYLYYTRRYTSRRRLNNAIIRIQHDSIHCVVHIMCRVTPDVRVNIKSSSVRYTYTNETMNLLKICVFEGFSSPSRRKLHNYQRPTRTHIPLLYV